MMNWRHAWQTWHGACMARGDMHSGITAIEASVTHPTGMHSCCVMFLTFNLVFDRNLTVNGLISR